MIVRVVPVLPFIGEPAIRPNLCGPKDLLTGAQDNSQRLVVEY
jgi:hypothetical protein